MAGIAQAHPGVEQHPCAIILEMKVHPSQPLFGERGFDMVFLIGTSALFPYVARSIRRLYRENPADIIVSVDEPIDATQCGGKENCHDEHRCMTHDLWATLNFKMYEYLSSVSLHDLVTRNAHKVVDVLPIKDQRVGPRPRAKIMAFGV